MSLFTKFLEGDAVLETKKIHLFVTDSGNFLAAEALSGKKKRYLKHLQGKGAFTREAEVALGSLESPGHS